MERHPDFTLEEMERFWPHKVDGEGHFVAKLREEAVWTQTLKLTGKPKRTKIVRTGKNETKPALTKENMKLLSEFLDETISEDMAAWIKTQGLSCLGSSSTGCLIWKLILKGLRCSELGFI